MYFRLTQVDVQEGKMDETIAYASGVMDSFVDTPGLYQICIAEMRNGQMTSWTTWASVGKTLTRTVKTREDVESD